MAVADFEIEVADAAEEWRWACCCWGTRGEVTGVLLLLFLGELIKRDRGCVAGGEPG